MKITRQIVVFDAADLSAESAFWAGLLGGTVEAEDDWHSVYVEGEERMVSRGLPGLRRSRRASVLPLLGLTL
jgi:hypothetical protein